MTFSNAFFPLGILLLLLLLPKCLVYCDFCIHACISIITNKKQLFCSKIPLTNIRIPKTHVFAIFFQIVFVLLRSFIFILATFLKYFVIVIVAFCALYSSIFFVSPLICHSLFHEVFSKSCCVRPEGAL